MSILLRIDTVFRNAFSDLFTEMTSATFFDYLVTLSVSFVLGILLYWIYGLTYKGVAYQKSFHESLIFMCMISAMIITTISANIVLSLGMVGALSIVRFRTPIKDPMDMMYLYLCIGVGIATGARQYSIAAFGTIFIGILLFLFSRKKPGRTTYMLVIRYTGDRNEEIKKSLSKYSITFKSSAVTDEMTELTLEITGKNLTSEITKNLSALEGVESAVMMRFAGD